MGRNASASCMMRWREVQSFWLRRCNTRAWFAAGLLAERRRGGHDREERPDMAALRAAQIMLVAESAPIQLQARDRLQSGGA